MTNPVRARNYAALTAWLNAPAVFGYSPDRLDCVRDCLGAVRAQGGDVTLPCRWTTERGAKRCLDRLGGLEAAVDTVLAEVPTGLARRGDIGLVRAPDGTELLMIVEGETLAGLTEAGRRRLPRRRMVKAWSAL